MSGELEIDHGGAIAVDTDQLRDVGARMAAIVSHYDEARAAIESAYAAIDATPALREHVDTAALRVSGERVRALSTEIEEASAGTLLMADAFEVVELRAEAEALALTDSAAAQALQARIDRMVAADERIGKMADWLVAGWKLERFEGLGNQWNMGGLLPPIFLAGALVGVTAGVGKVLPGMTLKGESEPVRVTPVKSSAPAAPPASLKGALGRMPSTPGAQIAVEKATMADGSTSYTAYIVGTQNFALNDAGGAEPWDMKSNAELYTGEMSASYQATLDALAAAGAKPGDRVDVFGHSQAGMIATHLAMESDYEVPLVVTAGSPTEPTLGDDQMLVQLAHTDDVVRSMAGGGSPAGTGSPDSFTATRVGDPNAGIQDMSLRTHALETYRETAAMVDASHDPRAEALDKHWATLGEAVSVERTEYRAERLEPTE